MGLLVSGGLLLLALIMPNTQQIMDYKPPVGTYGAYAAEKIPVMLRWKAIPVWALFSGALFALCLMFMTQVSEFIYFQF
jgi:hypothetical protein